MVGNFKRVKSSIWNLWFRFFNIKISSEGKKQKKKLITTHTSRDTVPFSHFKSVTILFFIYSKHQASLKLKNTQKRYLKDEQKTWTTSAHEKTKKKFKPNVIL